MEGVKYMKKQSKIAGAVGTVAALSLLLIQPANAWSEAEKAQFRNGFNNSGKSQWNKFVSWVKSWF